MKSSNTLAPWWVALGLVLACLVIPAGTARAQAIVSTEAADGSVELSNTSAVDSNQEPVAEGPAAAQAADSAKTESGEAEPAKDPRELHRDLVMQVPDVMPAGTSAASRRYKKVDLATYRAQMHRNAAQPAQ